MTGRDHSAGHRTERNRLRLASRERHKKPTQSTGVTGTGVIRDKSTARPHRTAPGSPAVPVPIQVRKAATAKPTSKTRNHTTWHRPSTSMAPAQASARVPRWVCTCRNTAAEPAAQATRSKKPTKPRRSTAPRARRKTSPRTAVMAPHRAGRNQLRFLSSVPAKNAVDNSPTTTPARGSRQAAGPQNRRYPAQLPPAAARTVQSASRPTKKPRARGRGVLPEAAAERIKASSAARPHRTAPRTQGMSARARISRRRFRRRASAPGLDFSWSNASSQVFLDFITTLPALSVGKRRPVQKRKPVRCRLDRSGRVCYNQRSWTGRYVGGIALLNFQEYTERYHLCYIEFTAFQLKIRCSLRCLSVWPGR